MYSYLKPIGQVNGSIKTAIFSLIEGLIFIVLSIAVNHSSLADVDYDEKYALGGTSLEILKIKNLFNNVSAAFFGFLVVASILPPTAVRKGVPFFYAIYILLIMVMAVFMVAGIAVYAALYHNIREYDTTYCKWKCAEIYENRYAGTLAMLIVYAGLFVAHCLCASYSIYHFYRWRKQLRRSNKMEVSAMRYHNGVVNASYAHEARLVVPLPPENAAPKGTRNIGYRPFLPNAAKKTDRTNSETPISTISERTRGEGGYCSGADLDATKRILCRTPECYQALTVPTDRENLLD